MTQNAEEFEYTEVENVHNYGETKLAVLLGRGQRTTATWVPKSLLDDFPQKRGLGTVRIETWKAEELGWA